MRARPHPASFMRKEHWPLLVVLAMLAWLCCGAVASAQHAANESSIRAAMVVNMARFIGWPAWKSDAEHPQFVICILGADPIEHYSASLEHQTIDSGPVVVRHLTANEPVNSCHVLYIGVAQRKRLSLIEPELTKNAVLTVSERSNAITGNQVVGLPAVDDHIHIEINLSVAQRSNLQISSRLLRLATVTRQP